MVYSEGKDRKLVADFYHEEDREFYFRARTLLPALVTALRQRPGRETIERALVKLEEAARCEGAGGEYGVGPSKAERAAVVTARREAMELLGYGPEGEAR